MMRTTVTSAFKLEALQLEDAIAKTPEPQDRGRGAFDGLTKIAHDMSFSSLPALRATAGKANNPALPTHDNNPGGPRE